MEKRDIQKLITGMLAEEAQLKREKGISTDSALYAEKSGDGKRKPGARESSNASRHDCHKYKADQGSGKAGERTSGGYTGQRWVAKVTDDALWVLRESSGVGSGLSLRSEGAASDNVECILFL